MRVIIAVEDIFDYQAGPKVDITISEPAPAMDDSSCLAVCIAWFMAYAAEKMLNTRPVNTVLHDYRLREDGRNVR